MDSIKGDEGSLIFYEEDEVQAGAQSCRFGLMGSILPMRFNMEESGDSHDGRQSTCFKHREWRNGDDEREGVNLEVVEVESTNMVGVTFKRAIKTKKEHGLPNSIGLILGKRKDVERESQGEGSDNGGIMKRSRKGDDELTT
ncbi:uncharacterized protein G2W53_003584 [Senna tora]|uniref:Uncharacterized protein n=1 Tax=Senna tora TaxID=362788 RepID=A0A835CFV7_9FABA|nr:uncharacterized protein G2W53_003584 [Senna tora]